MSAGLDSSNAVELVSGVAQQSFNRTAMSCLEGRPVVRFPEQLRLHRALEELGWAGAMDEFNNAGFECWRLAMLEGGEEIHCIEYPLGDDEAPHFIISHHQPRQGWNAFIRIRLALTVEPYLQLQRTAGSHPCV
jgi:hypothetical protein